MVDTSPTIAAILVSGGNRSVRGARCVPHRSLFHALGAVSGIDASSLMAMRGVVLARSEALQKVARAADTGAAVPVSGFGQMLNEVNALQAKAGALSEGFERGTETDIAQVMLARQKASISFEATLQVRNKLLSAYRDIMNMPA